MSKVRQRRHDRIASERCLDLQEREIFLGSFATEGSAAKAHDMATLRLRTDCAAASQVQIAHIRIFLRHSIVLCRAAAGPCIAKDTALLGLHAPLGQESVKRKLTQCVCCTGSRISQRVLLWPGKHRHD